MNKVWLKTKHIKFLGEKTNWLHLIWRENQLISEANEHFSQVTVFLYYSRFATSTLCYIFSCNFTRFVLWTVISRMASIYHSFAEFAWCPRHLHSSISASNFVLIEWFSYLRSCFTWLTKPAFDKSGCITFSGYSILRVRRYWAIEHTRHIDHSLSAW